MSQQPEKNVQKKPEGKDEGLRGLGKALWRFLTHNWPFKLVSLLLAIFLWSGLITQDPTLTREKAFSDVTITVAGEETMKRNGFIVVSDLEEAISGARMRAEVPQMQYNSVSPSNFNARIDLSRVQETGVQELRVLTTSSATWGSVIEVIPSTVEVEVEEYITRYRIPVSLTTSGEAPAGFYAATPSLDPPNIAVSGPKSLVERVARAEANLELSDLPAREGLVRTSATFTLLDSKGNAIESELLEVTSESVLVDSVVVEQYLYTAKELDLSTLGLVTGEPATGYEVKSVTITPGTIVAAGWAENLDALDALYADAQVDVTGASASFTEQIRVRQPSELQYMSSTTVTVAVEIGPVILSRTFDEVRVNVEGAAEGYSAQSETARASVTITGPQLWVEGLRSGDLTLVCDATGLTAGTYELPILCQVAGGEQATYDVTVSPAAAQVEIRER